MTKVKDILRKYCKKKGYYFEQDEDNKNLMYLPFCGTNLTSQSKAIFNEESRWLEFYSTASLPIKKGQKEKLLELTNTVNWNTLLVNILVDFEKEFLAVCTSVPYQCIDNDGDIFEIIINGNVYAINYYYPAYLSVIYGDKSVEEALDDLDEFYFSDEIEESKKELPN